ncbi:MAG: hypothetical protein JWO47_846 [Candidatus Saccharibacteria bacterium]|nr:hypothetical protein [Candidatus Saccharibacteria bacterium]
MTSQSASINIGDSYYKKLWLFFGLSIVICFLMAFWFGSAKVHANQLNLDPGSSIPSNYYDYLANCNSALPQYNPSHSSPAIVQWVADSSGGEVQTIEVQPGNDGRYRLQYILAGAVCFSNNAVSQTFAKITSASASTGTVNNAVDKTTGITYAHTGSPGSYDASAIFFDYDFGGPITTTQNITFTISTKVLNHFTSGLNGCVTGAGSTIDTCTGQSDINISLTFEVSQHAPIANLDSAGSCSVNISGWGFDQDAPGTGLAFHTYLDHKAGEVGAIGLPAQSSTVLRSDVNNLAAYSGYGLTGKHGFSFAMPDAYKYSDHAVYVYAIGVDPAGSPDGTNALVSGTFTACPPEHPPAGTIVTANCSKIAGNFSDSDHGGSYKIDVYFGSKTAANKTTISTDSSDNWSITVPNKYKHAYDMQVWVEGYGKANDGTEDADATTLANSPSDYGTCQSSACSSVVGDKNNAGYVDTIGDGGVYTIQRGDKFKIKMVYKNTAPAIGGTTWSTGQESGQVDVGTDGPAGASTYGKAVTSRLAPFGGNSSVAPGSTASYAWSHDSSEDEAGDYTVKYEMVQEPSEWFGSTCGFTIRVVLPPPVITCTLQPGGTYETTMPYTPQATITHSGPKYSPSFSNMVVTFSVDGTQVGTYGPKTVANGSSASAVSSGPYTSPDPGKHNVTATVTGSPDPASPIVCEAVSVEFVLMPYLKTFGADISTGSNFSNNNPVPTCTSTTGGIYGFASGSGPSYKGASAQYGAMARGPILGFFTASNRSSLNNAPKGLTFSNTNALEFGGNYGPGLPCITDYFSDPTSVPAPLNGGTRDPGLLAANGKETTWGGSVAAGLGKHRYIANGNIQIAGLTIPAGTQAAIYIKGNLTISGDVSFDPASSIAALPNLAIIVRGNIFITPNVQRIDGLFVAQPTNIITPSDGRIYTCANPFAAIPAVNLATACGNSGSAPLAVNGALVAQQVKFLRTMNSYGVNGTASNLAPYGEIPNFANGSETGNGANTRAAEVINYTPEVYLAPSAIKSPDLECVDISCKYESIYSLPPVY